MAKSKTTTKSKSEVESAAGKSTVKAPRQEIVRDALKDAHAAIEQNYMELCKLLYEAYHKEYYQEWGFEDFSDYCEAELDIKYRKAMYLIDIWDKVKKLNLSQAKVAKIGWTKMKDIATVINEDNAKDWLDKAEKMTSRDVTEAVKVTRRPDHENGAPVPTITTMTLKMSEGEANIIMEAIEEAKKLTESANAVVALEMICQDWLTDKGAAPERTSIEDHVKFIEGVYGVKVTYTTGKKAAKSDKAKAKEVEAKAEEKAAARKKKDVEEDSIEDLLEPSGADLDDDVGGDDEDEVSINDIIGLD